MKVTCKQCKSEFDKQPAQIIKFPNHFCSRSCSATHNNAKKERRKKRGLLCECLNCHSGVYRQPNQLLKNSLVFCGHKCQMEHKSLSVLQPWLLLEPQALITPKGKVPLAIRKYIFGDNPQCAICGQGNIWNNKPITLHLDHTDGNCENGRPDNLRILCPNCHTQTDTYGSRNSHTSTRYSGWRGPKNT